MAYKIRTANDQDAPALADLLQRVNLFSRMKDEPPETTRKFVTQHLRLCLADDSHSLWVAEGQDGTLLGYISVHWLPYLIHTGPEGYVSEIFIDEAARGQGLGSALLDTAVAEARRRGCARMMLVNVRQRESYQRGFYKKMGWEEREDAASFMLRLKP